MEFQEKDRTAVITAGFRTPFMLSGQDFKNLKEDDLGASALKELIERTPLKTEDIEELIIGNSEGAGGDLASSIARRAGLSESVSSWTVKKGDLSSFESLLLSNLKIKQGRNDIIVAGGVESISQKPFLFQCHKVKEIFRGRGWKEKAHLMLSLRPSDMEWQNGAYAPFSHGKDESDWDRVFADFSISRVEQENFVSESCQKARQAQKEGKVKEEIIPIFPPVDFEIKDRDGALSRPLWTGTLPDSTGPEERTRSRRQALWADGAVFFLIMSRAKAQALGYVPLVSFDVFALSGGREHKALSPLYATEKALKKAGLQPCDIDLWEIGENRPAQTLAILKELNKGWVKNSQSSGGEVDPRKCNVNGGALALGDPPGATFARMVLSLMREMKRRQVEWGLATMGLYSHQAGALILKNEAVT